jgi:hypothetical protein
MIRKLLVGVAVLACLIAIVKTLRPTGVSGQNPEPPLCTMPTDVKYSPGAIAPHGDQYFQCLLVFGENLKPAGVAWIEMVRSGNDFVPKGPGGR